MKLNLAQLEDAFCARMYTRLRNTKWYGLYYLRLHKCALRAIHENGDKYYPIMRIVF